MKEAVLDRSFISPEAMVLFQDLEKPNWAPWLRFGPATLSRQEEIFPEGQIILHDAIGNPTAMLSANRIDWDGNPDNLPTWDGVAGQTYTYEDTFAPNGNTFVLMSMGVRENDKGNGQSNLILRAAKNYALSEGIEHITGDFRPSDFGKYKREFGNFNFNEYVMLQREDGQPYDGWIRNVTRQGMEILRTDPRAMVIEASISELEDYYLEHKPEQWWKVEDPVQIQYLLKWHQPHENLENVDEVWECGETGTWYIDRQNDKAIYIESNLWGELPIMTYSKGS